LYLSVYGAFAYYHLVDQRTAFIFLAILVAEAHLLAMEYDAPSVAVLALVGGFLVPLLLSTGRDQYRVLFTYIGILDLVCWAWSSRVPGAGSDRWLYRDAVVVLGLVWRALSSREASRGTAVSTGHLPDFAGADLARTCAAAPPAGRNCSGWR